ncbi:hypothetical protein [Glaciecola sp. KUL10]|uniref:hypothetical protein n=1 Tax=Glaciecola sp. (strain KUL10) TaxID=2161813 RepID=UPI000D7836E7|nr:hypothetical protein [Glaciecola sp. KUL10]GBL04929.1 phosphoenolpyruvate-protein phosphotransferase PtsP [Glaciecola sp. KUL10]
MALRIFFIIILLFSLIGCAAGMRGVHTGNIEIYANLIQELGPVIDDTEDEARRRKLYWNSLEESLQGLKNYYPAEAEQWRITVQETLGRNPYK